MTQSRADKLSIWQSIERLVIETGSHSLMPSLEKLTVNFVRFIQSQEQMLDLKACQLRMFRVVMVVRLHL